MLEEHVEMRPQYRATLIAGDLIIEEVPATIYMRIGTEGLGSTKLGAVEKLKRRIMEKFAADLQRIDWQSMEYIR
jgi:hypothetical protein